MSKPTALQELRIPGLEWNAYQALDLERVEHTFQPAMFQIYKRMYSEVERICQPTRIRDVNVAAIEIYREQRLREGRAPSTVNRGLRSLGAALNRAVRRGLLAVNPFYGNRGALMVPELDPIVNVVPAEHVLRLLAAAPSEDWRTIIYVGFYGGLRLGEILALTWRDIEHTARVIHVRNSEHHRIKTGRERLVIFASRLARILAKKAQRYRPRPPADGWVIPTTGLRRGSGRITAPANAFRRICCKAGLVDAAGKNLYIMHDLRRTAISAWANAGIPMKRVMRMAGHKNLETTARYYQQVNEREPLAAINERVLEGDYES